MAYNAAEASAREKANLAIVQRFYDEYAAGTADVILKVHPDKLTMHYAGESEEVETQVLRDDLAAIKAANPDLHAEIHSMFASGDIVVTELTWTATHKGDFFDIPATGETVLHNGIVVRRLEDGKIVESWEIWDDLAFLQSIGYLPSWEEIIANPPPETK
ncbi:MAG: ester cyclase [Chloroflexi bacterium]|nr:ester cyclase [Chloroflexota bacterium]